MPMIRYIMVLPTAAIVVLILVMLTAIHILSSEAVKYEIRKNLRKSVEVNRYRVSVENKELKFAEDFKFRDENVSFVFIKRNGKVIEGEYPKGITEEMYLHKPKNNHTFVVSGDEKYYVHDIRIGKYGRKGVFIRGIMKRSDADSFYYRIEMIAYVSLAVFFVLFLIYEIFFARRISKELKNMCKAAERIGADMDISQRIQSESQIYEIEILAKANNRMLDCMEQMFQRQEQFTSDVAHELRTPLAAVMAQCQYAMNKVEDKEEFQEILEVIHRQSKKIHAIITQLLHFSRLDQDRMQLENETLYLMEIVASICEECQEEAHDAVEIKLHLENAVTTGDMNLIAIVIKNLVSNAVKFSHPGGVIDVSAGEEGEQVYVRVRDYGVGIAPEDTTRIFQRFYKCDKSRNEEGFGLGLPLSEKIAQKHGGNITVSSEIGKGSVFTLYLPRK